MWAYLNYYLFILTCHIFYNLQLLIIIFVLGGGKTKLVKAIDVANLKKKHHIFWFRQAKINVSLWHYKWKQLIINIILKVKNLKMPYFIDFFHHYQHLLPLSSLSLLSTSYITGNIEWCHARSKLSYFQNDRSMEWMIYPIVLFCLKQNLYK